MTSDGSVVELFEDATYKALKEGKAKITIKATTEYNKETVDENDENSNKDNEITSPILQRLSCYQQ